MTAYDLLRSAAPFIADTSAWWRVIWLPFDLGAVADAATRALSELAQHNDGYHRVPVTDAPIAAAAAEHGGLAVLHRDAHFARLAGPLAFESVMLPAP